TRAPPVRALLIMWAVVAIIALIPAGLIIAAPLLLASGHTSFALAIYEIFSRLCHQLPERSFHIEGEKFAVCSRCTGIYFGFALSVLLYPLARSLKRIDTPRISWLLLATLPITVDWALGVTGLWDNTHLSRFLTGALFSAVASVYVVPGLLDLGQSIRRRFDAPSRGHDQSLVAVVSEAVAPGRSAPSDYGSPSSRI
nr:DUF2085 domain-containing protein [Acidobacteriota bacterium]